MGRPLHVWEWVLLCKQRRQAKSLAVGLCLLGCCGLGLLRPCALQIARRVHGCLPRMHLLVELLLLLLLLLLRQRRMLQML